MCTEKIPSTHPEQTGSMSGPDGECVYTTPICWDVMNILETPSTCNVPRCDLPSKLKNEAGNTYCGRHKKQGFILHPLKPIYIRGVKEYTPFEIQTRLIRVLDKYPRIYDSHYIFIENQDDNNPLMKTIAASVFAYYTKLLYTDKHSPILKQIRYISARQKTTKVPVLGEPYQSPKTGAYAKRKDTSIEYCKRYLERYHPDKTYWFLTHRKKDDLADSYMTNKAAIWQLQMECVYPNLSITDMVTICESQSIPVKKENGKPYTKNQLLTKMKQQYVWVPPPPIPSPTTISIT